MDEILPRRLTPSELATRKAFALVGGEVVDGTGKTAQRMDVLLRNGYIERVSANLHTPPDAAVIDVRGAIIAPGFIDLHTHCDFTLPLFPRAESMTRQGVTTVVVGNCGFSPFPLTEPERTAMLRGYTAFFGSTIEWNWRSAREFMDYLDSLNLAPNVACLVGHNALRIAVMGLAANPPSGAELAEMKYLCAEALAEGAFGLSSGLIYPPGAYADRRELVAICEVVREYGGFYATHLRDEGAGILGALEEAVAISAEARISLQISHHKIMGASNWGLSRKSLALLEHARDSGVDVLIDQYPYTASSTTLAALMPPKAVDGGVERLQRRLRDVQERKRIRQWVLEGVQGGHTRRDFEPDTVMVASGPPGTRETLQGKRLVDLACERGQEPVDTMLDLLTEHGGAIGIVVFAMCDEDLERIMQHPQTAIASDGWVLSVDVEGVPHPRNFGTYPRVLGEYVREKDILTLPEAIRKMTSLPAQRLGITDRGRIVEGARADVIVFHPEIVRDRSSYLDSLRYANGVSHVFVNGVSVVYNYEDTGLRAGSVLRAS